MTTRSLIAAAVAVLIAGPALAEGASDPQQLPGQVTTHAQGWSGARASFGPAAPYGSSGQAQSADQRATDLEAVNLGR